ncbi:MAG: SRPBCC domain-containing protein [Siphonobacter aquaeclarae]|nr:SRPBCC domain-containing protein [Siphonobacter aquaeclarae]
MEKLDLTKTPYYKASAAPSLHRFGPRRYLSVTGIGDPSSAAFREKVGGLYALIYKVKFTAKAAGADFVVPKMEGLWWYDTDKYGVLPPGETMDKVPRSDWHWQIMLQVPEYIKEEDIEKARAAAIQKTPLAGEVNRVTVDEGDVVQVLHIGPYTAEEPALEKIIRFMKDEWLESAGEHHEIYLSDPAKTEERRLRTIIRHPVRRVSRASIWLDASPEVVWDALVNPAKVKEYFFGTTLEATWEPGSPLRFTGEWDGQAYEDKGVVKQVDPEKYLAYTYWTVYFGTEDRPENYVNIEYSLTKENSGTRLSVAQDGKKDRAAAEESAGHWEQVLNGLKSFLEK